MRKFLIAALVVIVLSLGWAADHYHDKAIAWRTTAQQSQRVARQQAATITDINQRQQQLAALDKTHTEALSAAESENDALRRQLAAGARRMYVHAKCPVSGTGTATGTGGLGDGAAVELAADSRRNVLDIRAGIIRDREKLKYLQEYVVTQCLRY
ncbi:lysis protein [Pantoea sp. Bo_2]|uniref:lysis system i-spanin subunit Rz n=1 Tax=unclassified Pantoea TaxID=2630326 RepID=UPI001232C88B|nr:MULTISPECIES: lysis system i-spanin subunit Rz [unclassified Pantoea]KAA5936457.1 lysis protein [Pantoea sp. VH_3]KAA5949679.1 lysis protein [Pantoea sp. VH_25]KAA5955406.1 lysis protein [Pantoea sp. VH_24]KAA5958973.1 lysis protein [Pantoea sp. VH_16]KAA5964171.1 lysis protein [Pantoea sp. VH_18]